MFPPVIVNFLTTYFIPTIYFGSFFLGEAAILPAAFLSAQGIYSPIAVFGIALIGTVSSDSIWFFLGEPLFKRFGSWKRYEEKMVHIQNKLHGFTGKRPYLMLLFIKFFYGARVLTIMYVASRRVKYRTFLLFNTLGTLPWLAVLISIGWLAGRNIVNAVNLFGNIRLALSAIILALIVVKLASVWIRRKVLGE
ncbi:MAG TPA: VTT domain-containing protein [Patescibacteria group bacterium]|nr:VTT domain-containing protein [Patescibacteria group bacterium]